MPDYTKLDAELLHTFKTYEAADDEAKSSQAGISVSLTFEGPISAIDALGFRTESISGAKARGIIFFADLPAITDHPAVIWIAIGRTRDISLDTAVTDIRARASSTGTMGAGGDGLWHIDNNTETLSQAGNATGAGVIIAIIDTGIDYKHPKFMKPGAVPEQTRILRIWDQGITPAALADCPDKALLIGETYGVEFDQAAINAALASDTHLGHRDCVGHGTHVAGTAAGGPLDDGRFTGVAPEADIIAVKLLDVPRSFNFFSGAPGIAVDPSRRFQDAVLYCLRTARLLGKPIVINMSFGNSREAGDGLDEDSIWVDGLLDPNAAEGPMNFPKGAVIVKAAGNDADPGRRQCARITIPPGGSVVVPLILIDTRGAVGQKRQNCVMSTFSPWVGVAFWYRRTTPFDAVKFALRYPDAPGFSGDMSVGGSLAQGFGLRVGPPRQTVLIPDIPTNHGVRVTHAGNPAVNHPDGGTVRRHQVNFDIRPKVVGSTATYYEGIYEMRITAPPGTEIFAMCDVRSWAKGLAVRFAVNDKLKNGTAINPSEIAVGPEFSIGDPLGRHVITVAACNETDGNAADPDHWAIASFSSRGPLRDFSDPPGSLRLIADKPDIAAPGVNIKAAQSIDNGAADPFNLRWFFGPGYINMQGTSMAAPMVAGVCALMLNRKPDLNASDIKPMLARAGVSPGTPPAHEHAYGEGMVDALANYLSIP